MNKYHGRLLQQLRQRHNGFGAVFYARYISISYASIWAHRPCVTEIVTEILIVGGRGEGGGSEDRAWDREVLCT